MTATALGPIIMGSQVPQRLIDHIGQRIHHYGFLALAVYPYERRQGFAGFFATKQFQEDYCRHGVHCYFDCDAMDKALRIRFGYSVWEKPGALAQDVRQHLSQFGAMAGQTTFSTFIDATESLNLHGVEEASVCLVRSKVITSGDPGSIWERSPLFYPLGLVVEACKNSPDMLQSPIPMLNLHLILKDFLPAY